MNKIIKFMGSNIGENTHATIDENEVSMQVILEKIPMLQLMRKRYRCRIFHILHLRQMRSGMKPETQHTAP